jgi:hypothetical protein
MTPFEQKTFTEISHILSLILHIDTQIPKYPNTQIHPTIFLVTMNPWGRTGGTPVKIELLFSFITMYYIINILTQS